MDDERTSKFHQVPDALWERIEKLLPKYTTSAKVVGRDLTCVMS